MNDWLTVTNWVLPVNDDQAAADYRRLGNPLTLGQVTEVPPETSISRPNVPIEKLKNIAFP